MFGGKKKDKKPRYSIRSTELINDITKVDDHPYPLLWVYDNAADTSGEHTAQLMNELPRRGWKLRDWKVTQGGGISGNQIMIYSIFQRVKNPNK